jgi:hypothetical protein
MPTFNNDLRSRSRALPNRGNRAIAVTHPTLTKGDADRYVLGMARTETDALRILRKAPVPQTFCKARQRLLVIGGGHVPVWEPAPCAQPAPRA